MLPPDIIAGAPIVTINGRNSISIENHRKIIEYTGEKIKISTKICNLCIEGKNLKITYYTKEELKVTGIIHSVYYQQGA
ncbi:MAG TPA: sporulation protein [Lachnoclostridium phytofermentans]|uniref:Sporulation protein n=2 Tax=Lachnoclostridium TaxID=1506553 RepID=A0A3D2X2M1_9FIRM|nr:sporulation protein [Lachnoclostridium phytofermentans]